MTIAACLLAALAAPPDVGAWLDGSMDDLSELYVHLHRTPEVSHEETETARHLAAKWRDAGFEVTEGVGGTGIVGVLENGEGPTVLLRTDLDALPVTENTGLPYASEVVVESQTGGKTGVMHACGHDVHMTSVTGAASYLASHRDTWSGTLVVIGQPAEELGEGAAAMLADGLFERFPRPDYAVALHVAHDLPTGWVGMRGGYAMANVDSVDITMKGRGGHGSKPETTIDPVVQAAELVVALQTIVSREVAPTDPAVVTVGSIHGGTKHNIIGDECRLQLTVRSYAPEVRKLLLSAIERKAKAVAAGHRAEEPDVVISQGTPSLFNDEDLAARLRPVLEGVVGEGHIRDNPPSMGGEDFSRYGQAGVPILMFSLGTIDPERLKRIEATGVPAPSLHSAKYYPDPEESIRAGVRTLAACALELLGEGPAAQ